MHPIKVVHFLVTKMVKFLMIIYKNKLDMEKIKYAFFFIFIGKAALISAMLLVPSTSAQMPVQKDTFEKSVRTEYVTNPADTLADDVYVLTEDVPVGNKERGEFFNRWFWSMVACADDNGEFQDSKLGNAPKFIKVPNGDHRQLAADIICTFDENGDNKVSYGEYVEKSVSLLEQKSGKKIMLKESEELQKTFLLPLFDGFDYDRNKKEYTLDEVAATIYALDQYSSLGKGILSGETLLEELNYVFEKGRPDFTFEHNRAEYYKNNVRR